MMSGDERSRSSVCGVMCPLYLTIKGTFIDSEYGEFFGSSVFCEHIVSPWSDVNTTIVLSSSPASRRASSIIPKARSTPVTDAK